MIDRNDIILKSPKCDSKPLNNKIPNLELISINFSILQGSLKTSISDSITMTSSISGRLSEHINALHLFH